MPKEVKEILENKLEQIASLLKELEGLLAKPFREFKNDMLIVRASERDFQLIVELASDINTTILVDKTGKTPDTYRQSFSDLEKLGIIKRKDVEVLINSEKLRNILVHEYDFTSDVVKFYNSAKAMTPAYREYLKIMHNYIKTL